MSYIFIDQAMPSNKKSLKQPYAMTPKYITIHNTSNSAPAKNEVSYMQGNSLQTGFHVAIDEAYVIKCADYIIDLGKEGGDEGGTILACGTPEQIAAHEESYTGQYLKKVLQKG